MKRMFSKEELEAIIKNVTDIDEVKEDISNLEDVALNAKTKGFVDSEYNKSLNLFPYGNQVVVANNETYKHNTCYVDLKAGTYTLNCSIEGTIKNIDVRATDNTLIAQNYGNEEAITFTLENAQKVQIWFYASLDESISSTTTFSNIMLNVGASAEAYQAYNGAVLHEKDINPVLLWENATPNLAFEAGNITVGDTSPFKYLIIGFKHYAGAGYGVNYFKCLKELNKSIIISSPFGSNIRTRSMEITANTTIDVKTGYNNGTAETSSGIPVVIYGTNVL